MAERRLVEVIPGIYFGLKATNQICPQCGGSIVQFGDGETSCLSCSRPWDGKQEPEFERVQRRGLR